MDLQDFLTWAQLREPTLPSDGWFITQAFEYAQKEGNSIAYLLPPFQVQAFVYNLALHYIINTNSPDNQLFTKYFPNGLNTSDLLVMPSSTSDSTSSISNLAYRALNDMSFQQVLLANTPYGIFVLGILDSLRCGIVVV